MTRMLQRLFMVVALVMAAQVIQAQPAAADAYSRERSGSSRWAPQTGRFRASYFNQTSNDFYWEFRWSDPLHDNEINGRHRGMEMKANVNQNYADQYDGYQAHNFPSGSMPYRDTLQSDFGSGTGRNFGFGSGNANYFLVGTSYWATVGVYKTALTTSSWPVDVTVRAATRESHEIPWCDSSPTFCVFPDYVNRLIRGRDFRVRQADSVTRVWNQNYMYNQSFEQGPANYSFATGNNYFVYCNGGGFGSNCFLQYNKGSGPYGLAGQNVNISAAAGDHYTLETMVRCRTGSFCPVRLAYWGLGGPGANENRVLNTGVYNDGHWYMCRLDYEHGASTGFLYSHSYLRWEVFNDSGGNMDLDFTHLGFYVDRTDGTAGDQVSPPPQGPGCQRAGKFDL